MKKIHALLGASLMLICAAAVAGYTQPAGVTISINPDGSGSAGGDMASARFANDDTTAIGCGIRTLPDGSGTTYGFCQATDENDTYVLCYTDNPQLLDVIKSLSAYSYIGFVWSTDDYYGAGPTCLKIDSSSQSFYIPDNVDKHKNK